MRLRPKAGGGEHSLCLTRLSKIIGNEVSMGNWGCMFKRSKIKSLHDTTLHPKGQPWQARVVPTRSVRWESLLQLLFSGSAFILTYPALVLIFVQVFWRDKLSAPLPPFRSLRQTQTGLTWPCPPKEFEVAMLRMCRTVKGGWQDSLTGAFSRALRFLKGSCQLSALSSLDKSHLSPHHIGGILHPHFTKNAEHYDFGTLSGFEAIPEGSCLNYINQKGNWNCSFALPLLSSTVRLTLKPTKTHVNKTQTWSSLLFRCDSNFACWSYSALWNTSALQPLCSPDCAHAANPVNSHTTTTSNQSKLLLCSINRLKLLECYVRCEF